MNDCKHRGCRRLSKLNSIISYKSIDCSTDISTIYQHINSTLKIQLIC